MSSDAKVYEVTRLKFGHKAFTNFSNIWIDCKLELGCWTQLEKADHDYIEAVIKKFEEYVKKFKIREDEIES